MTGDPGIRVVRGSDLNAPEATAAAETAYIGSDAEAAHLGLYGPPDGEGPAIIVSGYVEAVSSAMFELDGRPVMIRARVHGRLGTVASAGHPAVTAHPELWRPLTIAVMAWQGGVTRGET